MEKKPYEPVVFWALTSAVTLAHVMISYILVLLGSALYNEYPIRSVWAFATIIVILWTIYTLIQVCEFAENWNK